MFFLLQSTSFPTQLDQVPGYIDTLYTRLDGAVNYQFVLKELRDNGFPGLNWSDNESMKALRHIFANAEGDFLLRPTSEIVKLIYLADDGSNEYKILRSSICRALDVTRASHGEYNPGYKAFLLEKFLENDGIDMHELDFQVACMYYATWSGDLANVRDNADFIADLIINAPINYGDPYHGRNFFYSHVMNPLPSEMDKVYLGFHNFFDILNDEEKAQKVRNKMEEWRLYTHMDQHRLGCFRLSQEYYAKADAICRLKVG